MTEDINQQHHEAHPSRVAFANEVADIVESRIWSKLARWMMFNVGGLVGAVAVGIGAYYSLESRVNHIQAVDALSARQIDLMSADHMAIKAALSAELRDINQRLDEINRFLRDHSVLMNGTRK